MAVEIRGLPRAASAPHIPLRSRLYGLGSVFGKSLRDSRLGVLVVAGLLGVMTLAGGMTMSSTYGTAEARLELAAMSASMPPMLRGMYGNPVNVDTLGGFISWHYGPYFALFAGLWSILVLSSTLAGEARRGSLEFAVATPHSRRSIALQKVAAHVAAIGIAMGAVAVVAWVTGIVGATFPDDAISPAAAIAFVVGIGVQALVAGSIAFALASFLGRGAAAGIAGALMLGGYVINSYRTVVPAFDTLSGGTWFAWTAGHLPLAGQSEWAGVALTALIALLLVSTGVLAFARRDVGVTISLPLPGLPRALLGVHGPLDRSFGDLLPTATAWGLGLGVYGVLMAAASRSLLDTLNAAPAMAEIFRNIIPGIDITTAAGFLQLAFADIGFVLIGLATTTFIAARSSDETSGRLEIQLATPLTLMRWAAASGVAVWLAIVLVTVMLAAAVALGVSSVGQEAATPATGTLVLAVYGAALAGIGVAVAGVFRASFAMPVVLAVTIGTFLIDLLVPVLRLPDWVQQLALTAHLGEPMVGRWDAAGLAACLALAVGGLIVGAWGMSRRDVGT
jgi:ABC-2 type transport system permease protein